MGYASYPVEGGGAGTGTVTSIDVSGGVSGLVFTGGPITTAGVITITSGTLAVTYGGTGTSTQFTPGSVVFAGTSGVYTQDNANFFWDDTNNRLGLLTTSPTSTFSVGAGSQFQVNSTGNIVKINNVTTSFPSSQGAAATILTNNGSGVLSWSAPATSGTVTSVDVSGGSTGLTFSGGPITSSGTITMAGTLAIANGGTGQTSAANAFIALSPLTTVGDIIYENTGPTPARLPIGSTGNLLTVVGGKPAWAAPATSGTVTSINVSGGSSGLSFTGGPITSSGTITLASGPLGVTYGGTGTATQFTSGSVVFADGSGVYAQDNANFFWDDTNNRLGIGTATPGFDVDVQHDGASSSVVTTGYGTGFAGLMVTRAARGSKASPSAVQSADVLGGHNFRGYGATAFQAASSARINGMATENWSDSAQGAAIAFSTTPNGSTSASIAERVRIDQNGKVGVGTTSPGTQLSITTLDSATTTVTNIATLGHNSSGTPGVGFGSGFLFNGQSTTTADRNMALIQSSWTTATDASRASNLQFQTLTAAGSLTTQMTILGNGNVGIGTTAPNQTLHVVSADGSGIVANFVSPYNNGQISLGGSTFTFIRGNTDFNINTDGSISLDSSGTIATKLYTDATQTFNVRSGATASTLRVSNTYTSSTSYELGRLQWSANIFNVGTEKGSGGGSARPMALQTDATTRMYFDTTGNIGIGNTSPTSTFSIGSSSQFQVNSTGNIVKLNNVTTSFPSSQGSANTFLNNDGSGNLTWAAVTSTLNGEIQTTTGGGTTTLTTSNSQTQTFTSLTSAQTVKLPTTGVAAGDIWTVSNTQPYTLTIQSSGANTITTNWGCRVILQANVTTPTTAGNWTVLESSVLYGRTWAAYTPTIAGVGTAGNVQFAWMRDASNLLIKGYFTVGTASAIAACDVTIPAPGGGITIDTTNLTANANALGYWNQLSTGAGTFIFALTASGVCFYSSGAGTGSFRLAWEMGSSVYTPDVTTTYMGNGNGINMPLLTIPIAEWVG